MVQADGDGPVLSSTEDAYVHVLGFAADATEFRERAQGALSEENLVLTSFEDAEPLRERQLHGHISDDLLLLADEISEETPVIFGTFQSFDRED
jgi:hypothetical protein